MTKVKNKLSSLHLETELQLPHFRENINKIFWFITLTVFASLMIPFLVQKGMFLDGITYSTIAKNLANGTGTFWHPQYTKTLYPDFHEHPPLVFGIQALFYLLFGNYFWVDGFYSFLMAILTAVGIIFCWKIIMPAQTQLKNSWIPVLLWISIPLVSWAYKNNLLENTMGMFTVFSVYFLTKAMKEKNIILLAAGSLLIIPAFLSKGFTGLFPLAVPIIYSLIFKQKNLVSSLLYCALSLIIPIAVFFILWRLLPDLRENISTYLNQQLIPAVSGKREITADNRLAIIGNLLINLLIPLAFLILFRTKLLFKTKTETNPIIFRNSAYFFLIGLTASLPLIISLKQRSFYLVPSLPFYVLAIGILLLPKITTLSDLISHSVLKFLRYIFMLLATGVVLFSVFKFGDYSRDKDLQQDIYQLAKILPEGVTISTNSSNCSDWYLIAYLARARNISLSCNTKNKYFLCNIHNPELPLLISQNYKKLDNRLHHYVLLEKSDTSEK